MQSNLGDWRRVQFPSPNSPPSLTERTSSGPVRLREGQRFQRVSQVVRQWIQRAFFRLAWAPGKHAVGIFGGSRAQPVVMLGIKDPMVL